MAECKYQLRVARNVGDSASIRGQKADADRPGPKLHAQL
jgi:hypothetical protein